MSEIQFFPELVLAKLDYNVLLCSLLAGVVIPVTHTLLHSYVITVCTYLRVSRRWLCRTCF